MKPRSSPRPEPRELGGEDRAGPILAFMSTVAETLQEDSRERLRRMTPAERLAEALRLGQAAIAAYAAAHGLDRDEARRRLERAGQAGRRPSKVMLELMG
jgi:hypothetical protein